MGKTLYRYIMGDSNEFVLLDDVPFDQNAFLNTNIDTLISNREYIYLIQYSNLNNIKHLIFTQNNAYIFGNDDVNLNEIQTIKWPTGTFFWSDEVYNSLPAHLCTKDNNNIYLTDNNNPYYILASTNNAQINSYVVNNNTKRILRNIFYSNSIIQTLDFNNAEIIESQAVYVCKNLNTVIFGHDVKYIYQFAIRTDASEWIDVYIQANTPPIFEDRWLTTNDTTRFINNIYVPSTSLLEYKYALPERYWPYLCGVAAKGTLNSNNLSEFNEKLKLGNVILLCDDDGVWYKGEVNTDGVYHIDLPSNHYIKAAFLNYTADIDLYINDTQGIIDYNINFTRLDNYSTYSHSGLKISPNGSLLLNTEEKYTQETRIANITFMPNTEKLIFGYTLTGMQAGNKNGGHPLMGMFISTDKEHQMRFVNYMAGDVIGMTAADDYASRANYTQSASPWTVMGEKVGCYTFDKTNYKLEVEYEVVGYNIGIKMRTPDSNGWKYIYSNQYIEGLYQSYFNVENYFNNPTNKSSQRDTTLNPPTYHLLQEFADTLYKLDEPAKFGISARRDNNVELNNNAEFSNIYYRIEPRTDL